MKSTLIYNPIENESLKQINGGSLFNPFDGIDKHEVSYIVANILGPPASAVYNLGYLVGRLEG
jgi:hypothetical protein